MIFQISPIQVCVTFRNKYGFCTIPEVGNNHQFPEKTHVHYDRISQFLVSDQNFLLKCFFNRNACVTHKKLLKYFLLLEFHEISSILMKNG